ncbi:MAG: hypothetical protein ABID09_01510 [Candidatus Omnitrophota bacterium]
MTKLVCILLLVSALNGCSKLNEFIEGDEKNSRLRAPEESKELKDLVEHGEMDLFNMREDGAVK